MQSQSELEQIWRKQLLALARDAEAGQPVWRRFGVTAFGLPVCVDRGEPFSGIEALVLWSSMPEAGGWRLAEASAGPVVTRWTRRGRVFCRAIPVEQRRPRGYAPDFDIGVRLTQMEQLLRVARERVTMPDGRAPAVHPDALDIGLALALAATRHGALHVPLGPRGAAWISPDQLLAAAELGQLLAWATEAPSLQARRAGTHPALASLLPFPLRAPATARKPTADRPSLLDARPGRLAPRLLTTWRALKRQQVDQPSALIAASAVVEAALVAPALLTLMGGGATGRPVDDWFAIGARARTLVARRPDGEAPEWTAIAQSPALADGRRPHDLLLRLARRHRRASWIHLRDVLRIEDLLHDPWWCRGALAREAAILRATAPRKERPAQARLIELELRDLADAVHVPTVAPASEEALRQTLASALGPALPDMNWAGISQAARDQEYARRPLRGGARVRWLDVPPPPLARAQRALHELFLAIVPRHGSAAAFLPGRGVAWHAMTHAGSRAAVVVDVRDFFGSVRPEHLAPWLAPHRAEPSAQRLFEEHDAPGALLAGYSTAAQDTVLDMLFVRRDGLEPYLAQGAPSSPLAAHLAACRMDGLIVARAHRRFGPGGFRYSRYADDLVLSAPDGRSAEGFVDEAIALLEGAVLAQGWRPHPTKTRRWIAGRSPLVLCGLEVPQDERHPLRLAPQLAHRARAAEHRLRTRACYRDGGPDLREAVGLLAHAYAATGDARLLAWISPLVSDIGEALAGPLLAEWFLAGWAGP